MPIRCLLLALLLLAACAPPPAPAPGEAARLRPVFAELPGVRLLPGPDLALAYPDEALFGPGAALPLAGGTAVLDPLATLLADHPGWVWRGTVRARTALGEDYDRRLAEKRAELLERYFRNRGLGRDRLTLTAEAGAGPPLELAGRYPEESAASAATSSRENR